MPSCETPVQQVDARSVAPAVVVAPAIGVLGDPVVLLVDVAQVVLAVPEDGAVGIEGHAAALGIHEMVGWTVRVAQEDVAEFPLCLHKFDQACPVGRSQCDCPIHYVSLLYFLDDSDVSSTDTKSVAST